MIRMKLIKLIIASILLFSLIACSNDSMFVHVDPTRTSEQIDELTGTGNTAEFVETEIPVNSNVQPILEELGVVTLKLPERLQASSFEYSGLAWYGDYLVLLPQFADGKESSREPNFFAIRKADLISAVEDPSFELPVRDVPILNSDLRDLIKGFEGFESILFLDQMVYLTIESRAGNPMMGYLVRGEVQGELESVTLDPESLVEIVPFSSERNATFEAMTYWNENFYVIYEQNSYQGENQPVAYQYNQDLELVGAIPFPALDYRVTDATISDGDGKFWVMNYFFPGDTHLAVDQDALILEYGEGKSHLENEPVERLVQLQIGENQITRIDQAPTYLQLLDYNIARNWEGIVMLDDLGFLLITDSFPGSLLGFCPFLR